MDESKFLTAFLKPVYDDGLEEMETAVDAIRDGLDFYDMGAFVDAGEQFIAAGRSNDAASLKFREVLSLVEDPAVDYAKNARHRLIDCKRFQELAEDMESACDAMLAEKVAEAGALIEKSADAKKFAEEWKKE
jgi:predicted transcriptional regulator